MTSILEKAVVSAVRKEGMLDGPGGNRWLLGVSGGPDSLALLLVLAELRKTLGLSLGVACVDHGLRKEAAQEVAWVGGQASTLGVPFFPLAVNVPPGTGSLQGAARDVRLGALESLASDRGFGRVALAHTASDQVETVLFRILRGTGVRGLAGIPFVRGPFVRPMLDVTRDQVEAFLAARGVTGLSDPSNRNARFARVRLRHDLLPRLREENPKVDQALLALAADARKTIAGAPIEGAPPVPLRRLQEAERLAREGNGTKIIGVPGGRLKFVTTG